FGAKQQGGCELRALLYADAAFASARTGAMNQSRQAIVRRFNRVTELPQRAEQGSLGAFVHARNAMEAIHTFAKADQRAEETRRSSGVADKELKRVLARAAARDMPAASVN